MRQILHITQPGHPELEVFTALKEPQLYHYYEPSPGLFIAETPNVIIRALEAGYEPVTVSELLGFDPPEISDELYVYDLADYQ